MIKVTKSQKNNNDKNPLSSSKNNNKAMISYPKYQSLFHTEASTQEYKYNTQDVSKSFKIWKAQVKFDWEQLRNSPYNEKQHPFLLCYKNEELISRKRHERILKLITTSKKSATSSIIPFRIKESETCYLLHSTLKQSEMISKNIQQGITILPLSYAMKMYSGSVEAIEEIVATAYDYDNKNSDKKKEKEPKNPTLVTIDSILCPGIRSNKVEIRKAIEKKVMDHTLDTTKMHSKLFWKYQTNNKKSKQGQMWEDVLVSKTDDDTNDQCVPIYNTVQFTFDEIKFHSASTSENDHTIMSKMSMSFPNDASTLDTDEDITKSCLLRLMLSVTQLSDTCSLQVRPEYKALNQYGQWLVQAGIEDSTPWYDVGLNGTGQVISCSDTGIDMNHCYFKDPNTDQSDYIFGQSDTLDLSRRKVVQYDDYQDKSDYYHGHGTHVTGTIGGIKPNGEGVSKGIAPGAQIAFVDVCKGNSIFLIVPPVDRLLDAGSPHAKIHSMSWGSTYNGYGYYAWQFDTYLQTDDELLLVIAAGNSGDHNNDQSVGDPSTLKNGIAVGSAHSYSTDLTDKMLGPGYISYYSSRGPTLDGRTKPDILAPGHYISSSAAGEACDGQDPAEPYNQTEGLISYAGTSMATPITAATAALVRQYLAEGYYPSGEANIDDAITNPSASLIKAILLNGGQDMFGVDNGSDGVFPVKPYDNIQNMGRLSLVDSLYLPHKSNVQVRLWDRQTIGESDTLTFSKTINMTGGCNNTIFSAMLVWADPPPAQSYCSDCNINDLDLIVQKNDDPDNYFPNGYTGPDRKNNAERVRITNIVDGDILTMNVTGHTVFDLQNFSLVVSGCFGGAGNDIDMSDTVYQSEVGVLQQTDFTTTETGFNVLTGLVQ